jgi:hypothetical protein
MCYFCTGKLEDHEGYITKVRALRAGVGDQRSFLTRAAGADRLRFRTSPEWSEAPITEQVATSIFRNPNPSQGLLLLFLCAWLDLQAPYTRVWNQMLRQTQRWLDTTAWRDPAREPPRGHYPPTRPHLLKTIAALSRPVYSRDPAKWFAKAIVEIAEANPTGRGNIYRFAGAICRDLYEAKDRRFATLIEGGHLPDDYAGMHYKRLWMLIMFLRRDEGTIRCLISRALRSVPRGSEALQLWQDDRSFNSSECELPVDSRVKDAWKHLPFVSQTHSSVEMVAREARRLARKASVSPSSFDALLFVR